MDLRSSLIGAIAGYLSLWSVYHLFRLLTGKEGMGYGDFKLFAALGAWLGWQMLLPIILIAAAVGAVVGIAMHRDARAGSRDADRLRALPRRRRLADADVRPASSSRGYLGLFRATRERSRMSAESSASA